MSQESLFFGFKADMIPKKQVFLKNNSPFFLERVLRDSKRWAVGRALIELRRLARHPMVPSVKIQSTLRSKTPSYLRNILVTKNIHFMIFN